MIKNEYQRFLGWLNTASPSADACRVALIVAANLEAIIPTSSASGQRARMMARLLRADLTETNERIVAEEGQQTYADNISWQRLSRLQIGPFRGYRREEEFRLDHNVVLCQGPNGSGKTSFCEALEYALTGEVEEASAKRISDLTSYFDNIHEGTHQKPKLFALNTEEVEIPVEANNDLFRFAVIERNRIETFSRLAANTPARATSLIASLFGLDAFNTFVSNFNADIERYADLETPKQDKLRIKLASNAQAHKTITQSQEVQAGFWSELIDICKSYQKGITLEDLPKLVGTDNTPGRLQQLEHQIEQEVPPIIGIETKELIKLRRDLKANTKKLDSYRLELQNKSSQLSYRNLFEAVKFLATENQETCPACDTPLDLVTTNPIVKANDGLRDLQALAVLENQIETTDQNVQTLIAELDHAIKKLADNHLIELQALPFLNRLISPDQEARLNEHVSPYGEWRLVLRAATAAQQLDRATTEQRAQRDKDILERHSLRQLNDKLAELRGRAEQNNRQLKTARNNLQTLRQQNAALEIEVEAEKEHVALGRRCASAYSQFLVLLQQYRDGLPSQLIQNLNELTMGFYNDFNSEDHDTDKLASLKLPMTGGDPILISFNGNPDSEHDAIHVLSEGHLRCLGLSILLAKVVELDLPVFVLDDAVNAIDSDHRKGIRETIFTGERFRDKQIIVTCHSSEFIKDIQNILGQGASIRHVLVPHDGDNHPRLQIGTDYNYLLRASEHFENLEPRDCLLKSRQVLELQTRRIWSSLQNKDRGLAEMSLMVTSYGSPYQLRNLTERLKSKIETGIERGQLSSQAWSDRLTALKAMLEISDTSLTWQYLNGGVHEQQDREDFEMPVVRTVLDSLKTIQSTY